LQNVAASLKKFTDKEFCSPNGGFPITNELELKLDLSSSNQFALIILSAAGTIS